MSFSLAELLVVALVALFVIGPKDLPRVMRQMGRYAGKLRRYADAWMEEEPPSQGSAVKPHVVKGDDGRSYEAYRLDDLPPPTTRQ